jgi:hypothetical protein
VRTSILLTLLCLLITSTWSHAATTATMEIGVRGGADDSGHNLEENYVAAEIYLLKQLPWSTSINDFISLSSRLDIGITLLEAADEEGCMMAIGADLVFGLWDGNAEFEIGFRPTWMPDTEYGKDDYGGEIQFTSHVGFAINWHPVILNYRYQHTSNGSFYDSNPGLNLHMVGLGYQF